MNTYAIDFETTYTKDRDIKTLGVVGYVSHPDTDAYLVSIHGEDVSYAGPLEQAPWRQIDGHHWLSHNAGFDIPVFLESQKRGKIPADVFPGEWDCTANLAAFLAAPRSLAGASNALLGIVVDKGTRDQMKGKRWETMSEEFRQKCIEYALNDAKLCHALWEKYSPRVPEQELALSRHTLQMCLNGIAVDLERVEAYLDTIGKAITRCLSLIPWADATDAKGKEVPILSSNALKAACVSAGIPPPLTTADKSELFEAWLEAHGESAPFVTAVKNYRRLNRTRDILMKFKNQTGSDGRIRYSLKYGGAHTLRWSGDAGLNFHNFTKEPLCFDENYDVLNAAKMTKADFKARKVHEVDMRSCLVPAKGRKFIVADLSQIEARVSLWLACLMVDGTDSAAREQLNLIRDGMDLYEAHARSNMGYTAPEKLKDYCDSPKCPPDQKNLRQFAKCRVLGLGFGLGSKKFVSIVKQWTGLTITSSEAKRIVDDFREKNQEITRTWLRLDRDMRRHSKNRPKTEPYAVELPSWRCLEYFEVNEADGLTARDERGGMILHWYGGKLFENVVQATARDILGEAILRLEKAGYPVVLHVHDEVVCEVDPSVPVSAVKALMEQVPDWAEGLPIGCSAEESDRYFK